MPPARVVSLCPSITETLVAIGGLSRLVAATRYCVRPQGLLWGLPRIGGTKDPDLPRILDLRPDLVFANEEENRAADLAALREAGLPVWVTVTVDPADVRLRATTQTGGPVDARGQVRLDVAWSDLTAGAAHGWCPPDSGVYNEPQAEKAWSRLLALYGKALA